MPVFTLYFWCVCLQRKVQRATWPCHQVAGSRALCGFPGLLCPWSRDVRHCWRPRQWCVHAVARGHWTHSQPARAVCMPSHQEAVLTPPFMAHLQGYSTSTQSVAPDTHSLSLTHSTRPPSQNENCHTIVSHTPSNNTGKPLGFVVHDLKRIVSLISGLLFYRKKIYVVCHICITVFLCVCVCVCVWLCKYLGCW